MGRSILWKSLCVALLLSSAAHAATPDITKSPAIANQISMTCAGQLMALVASANQMKQMYKTPVLNAKDDQTLLNAMNELRAETSAIQSEQAQGKAPSKARIEKIKSIFVKPAEILKKAAPKEMDLCIQWMTKTTQECATYGTDPAKLKACSESSMNKPEIKKSMDAFMSTAQKRFLVPRS